MKNNSITYKKSGVDYDLLDSLKRMAQQAGKETEKNLSDKLKKLNFSFIEVARGESASFIQSGDEYIAFVQEGLGTKNLVADEMEKINRQSYYHSIAQDTVAMIINDLITIGALPLVVLAYWAIGNNEWLNNKQRMKALVDGWRDACLQAGAIWEGGETPILSGIVEKDTIDLAGTAIGIIRPSSKLVIGTNLAAGDAIVVFESSGIHANGLTLARKIAEKLPDGYATKMKNGQSYGEALLTPTIIYAKLINDLLESGVNTHYMANITGHGWRKLMRSSKPFTYRIASLPPVPEVLQFIQENGPVTDEEMYANFNMGAGFAIFVPQKDVEKILEISVKHKIKAYEIGKVESGEKRIIIEPKNIIYSADTLQVRG